MLRNEVQSRTGLTRKAIEYYEERGLINPKKSENGYRDYREKDLQILTKISLYRKVGLTVAEIEKILNSGINSLSLILRKKQYELEVEEKRKDILELIVKGEKESIINEKLNILEKEETIYEKLERAFPGYFGMMIFSAYQPFLNEPLSEDSKSAYIKYVKYLDNLPQFELSEEEQKHNEKNTSDIKLADLKGVSDARIKAVENFEKWWDENKDIVEKYEEFKKSDEYTNSLMKQIQDKLQKYIQENNYYDIAIPLIRKFSKGYDDYYVKLTNANEKYMKIR